MARQTLHTPKDVIETLGGNAVVGRITGVNPKSVSMWRGFKKLPAKTYIVLSAALQERGCYAPPSLWGMSEPEQQQAAS